MALHTRTRIPFSAHLQRRRNLKRGKEKQLGKTLGNRERKKDFPKLPFSSSLVVCPGQRKQTICSHVVSPSSFPLFPVFNIKRPQSAVERRASFPYSVRWIFPKFPRSVGTVHYPLIRPDWVDLSRPCSTEALLPGKRNGMKREKENKGMEIGTVGHERDDSRIYWTLSPSRNIYVP